MGISFPCRRSGDRSGRGGYWLAAQQSGVFALLQSLWGEPRSGPSPAHYLLLAAFHRPASPGPKTETADWYGQTLLSSLWRFEPECFSSQAFWDCFEQLLPEKQASAQREERDPLEEAQARLLGLWKEKQLVSRRLLAYDTTNFHTYIASTNTRNGLAQRGHNKQGRHDLRQVGLCCVRDGESGLSLCHHVYPGNVTDTEEFPVALERIQRLLARHAIPPETVTLVFDKGTAALANTRVVGRSGTGVDLGAALEPGSGGVPRSARWKRCPLAAAPSPGCAPPPRTCWCMGKSIAAC